MSDSLQVSVWRSAGGGSFATYEVPRQDSQTVLAPAWQELFERKARELLQRL